MIFWFLILGLLFVLGLVVGSFLNVVIYRSVHDDSPLRGRSYCDTCKKPIAWYDNIPLLSFLILGRKCRHCKEPIPWAYPAVEVLTGTLFVWWYVMGSTFFQLTSRPFIYVQPIFWLIVGILFVVIFFTDLSYYIIPNSAVLLLTIASLAYRIVLTSRGVMTLDDFVLSVAAAALVSLFFLSLVLVTKGKGMGMGDVKLVFPLTLIVGYPMILVALFCSFVFGAVIGTILIALKKRTLKAIVPFGPFLIVGTLVALLWGEELISFYLTLL